MYEPYVAALAGYLTVTLPPWVRETRHPDNWQTSAWEPPVALPRPDTPHGDDDHF
jgi:hypothetical protein